MPRRHIEARNIVFHIFTWASESLRMMKIENSGNGAAPFETKEARRSTVTEEHKQTHSARFDEASDHSTKEKKQSLFRRPSVIVVAGALAMVGIAYGAFAMFHSFTHESTDDAFIDVHFVSVAPKIAGHVAAVHVDDNQLVKKGDVLVEIDPSDFQVALAQARANLAKDKATLIQANANKERAQLNLGYAKIKAPIDGYVTKKAVTIGDYVQVGQALMSLVPPRVWVIANFKETQLRNMRPGQPATVSIDG